MCVCVFVCVCLSYSVCMCFWYHVCLLMWAAPHIFMLHSIIHISTNDWISVFFVLHIVIHHYVNGQVHTKCCVCYTLSQPIFILFNWFFYQKISSVRWKLHLEIKNGWNLFCISREKVYLPKWIHDYCFFLIIKNRCSFWKKQSLPHDHLSLFVIEKKVYVIDACIRYLLYSVYVFEHTCIYWWLKCDIFV